MGLALKFLKFTVTNNYVLVKVSLLTLQSMVISVWTTCCDIVRTSEMCLGKIMPCFIRIPLLLSCITLTLLHLNCKHSVISVRYEPVAHSKVGEGIWVQLLWGSNISCQAKSREMRSVFSAVDSCYRRKRASPVSQCNLRWKHRFKDNDENPKNSE